MMKRDRGIKGRIARFNGGVTAASKANRETLKRLVNVRISLGLDPKNLIAEFLGNGVLEPIELSAFPFGDHLNPAVVQVPHKTRYHESSRQAPRCHSEPDPLDPPSINGPTPFNRHDPAARGKNIKRRWTHRLDIV
jgi:hypothetical protein